MAFLYKGGEIATSVLSVYLSGLMDGYIPFPSEEEGIFTLPLTRFGGCQRHAFQTDWIACVGFSRFNLYPFIDSD